MKKVLLFALLCFSCFSAEYPLNQLKNFADGLNDEGGTIYQKYLHEGQIYANICVVLDRPFEDGMEWLELNASNIYPLKEASILEYNETQVNLAYVSILHYYITHAQELTGCAQPKILVQVHRNSSGPHHVALLKRLLDQCYPEDANTISLEFCYGADPHVFGKLGKYCDADIVLSFSLVAGFNPDWGPGTLLIPHEHIPFYLDNCFLDLENKYLVENHLSQIVKEIIQTQNEKVLSTINSEFNSLNPQKSHLTAKELLAEDFKIATLLHADGRFNPSQLNENYVIS